MNPYRHVSLAERNAARVAQLAELERAAVQADNRRAAVAVYAPSSPNLAQLEREAEAAWGSYYEVKNGTQ